MSPDSGSRAGAPVALVTGSRGQLGAAFAERLAAEFRCTGIDKDELDITDASAVRELVRRLRPRVVVNCAAYNSVDAAETSPLDALQTNAEAVYTLASVSAECDAVFVHYSTDFVFDGTKPGCYTENDPPRPGSMYGMSKLMGERCAVAAPRRYVLRMSSLYGGYTRRSFIDWIVTRASAGEPVQAFVDRTVSPSYVPDVVDATLMLLHSGAPFGLYHCGSDGWCTWHDLARHVLARLGRPDLLVPVSFDPSAFRAPRPRQCALSHDKLAAAGARVRPWKDAVDHYLSEDLRARVVP